MPVRALRVGFTGELGWELHLRIDDMPGVYDGLLGAGADLGVADVGGHALNSLRMEKAYRTSRDMTHDVDPVEAGLDFFVDRDKGDFVGRRRWCGGTPEPRRGQRLSRDRGHRCRLHRRRGGRRR